MEIEKPEEIIHNKVLMSWVKNLNSYGFETLFKTVPNGIFSLKTQKLFRPNQIKIIHFFRFERGIDDSSGGFFTIYGIKTSDGEKGTLIEKYEKGDDSKVIKFIQQTQIR